MGPPTFFLGASFRIFLNFRLYMNDRDIFFVKQISNAQLHYTHQILKFIHMLHSIPATSKQNNTHLRRDYKTLHYFAHHPRITKRITLSRTTFGVVRFVMPCTTLKLAQGGVFCNYAHHPGQASGWCVDYKTHQPEI